MSRTKTPEDSNRWLSAQARQLRRRPWTIQSYPNTRVGAPGSQQKESLTLNPFRAEGQTLAAQQPNGGAQRTCTRPHWMADTSRSTYAPASPAVTRTLHPKEAELAPIGQLSPPRWAGVLSALDLLDVGDI
jgi:hypothetical protein